MMPKLKDLTGARFGSLNFLSRAENDGDQVRWNRAVGQLK